LRLTQSREWANDIAQETFLNGFRHLDQLKDHNKYRSWIYSVAHTQFLQWKRSHESFASDENIDENHDATSASSLFRDPFAGTEVRELLQSLKPEEMSVLVLCLAHDFSHSEAASTLNLPLGTVKTLILRAREKIGAQS
jgi:RNA polymerase sigma-70 factor (ECF subfamily)